MSQPPCKTYNSQQTEQKSSNYLLKIQIAMFLLQGELPQPHPNSQVKVLHKISGTNQL